MRRFAFTLIELLVVIAIIAVLAAILFPTFAQAKNQAKTIACVSNMKQIGAAIQMYLNDEDDTFFGAVTDDPVPGMAPQKPWFGYDNNNAPLNGGFFGDVRLPAVNNIHPGAIDIYLRSPDITKCPSRSPGAQSALALNIFQPGLPSAFYTTHPNAQDKEFGVASMNPQTISGHFSFQGVQYSMIEAPSETLIAWEHSAIVPMCNFLQPYDWLTTPPDDASLKEHFNLLHNGGTNTLWGDSHAKRLVYGGLKRRWFSVRKDIYDN